MTAFDVALVVLVVAVWGVKFYRYQKRRISKKAWVEPGL
jgi:hypothetical protein